MVNWRHVSFKGISLALGIHFNPLTKRHNWVALILNVYGIETRWDVHDVYFTIHCQYGDWATWESDTPVINLREGDILL